MSFYFLLLFLSVFLVVFAFDPPIIWTFLLFPSFLSASSFSNLPLSLLLFSAKSLRRPSLRFFSTFCRRFFFKWLRWRSSRVSSVVPRVGVFEVGRYFREAGRRSEGLQWEGAERLSIFTLPKPFVVESFFFCPRNIYLPGYLTRSNVM